MRLLVDTHALLWWLAGDRRLEVDARVAIERDENQCAVSVATVWEIEIKRAAGRLKAPRDIVGVLDRLNVGLVAISAHHAVAAAGLPPHHADPFDRMLVAQAQIEGFTVVTRDSQLNAYDVPILAA